MTDQFSIRYAKTHLSRLVARVEAGDEILIARAGKPVARLLPVQTPSQPRTPGLWRGLVHIHPDFDRTDRGLLESFDG